MPEAFQIKLLEFDGQWLLQVHDVEGGTTAYEVELERPPAIDDVISVDYDMTAEGVVSVRGVRIKSP